MPGVVLVPSAVLFFGAIIVVSLIVAVILLQQQSENRGKEVKELRRQGEMRNRVFLAYSHLVNTLASANLKLSPPELRVDEASGRMTIRNSWPLVSKGELEVQVFTGPGAEHTLGARVRFPEPTVPESYLTLRAEDSLEQELKKTGLFKIYAMASTPPDLDWPSLGRDIAQAVRAYEAAWTSIKDRIPEVNAKIIAMDEHHQKLERELREYQQRVERELREHRQKLERELRGLTTQAKPQPTS